jgi:formylglycine-generating enzyme required for sulfatase activity
MYNRLFERIRENRMKTVLPIDIFVASSNELKTERERTRLVVQELGKIFSYLKLDVVGYETDIPSGSSGKKRIQDGINPLLDECCIVLVLLYSKIGSYTLEEYRRARDKGKTVFLYFKKDFSPKTTTECNHYFEVLKFKEKISADGLLTFETYDSITDFENKLYKGLNLYLFKNYAPPALDDEEVQPNDQEKMTLRKTVDRTKNERINNLCQEMDRMVKIPRDKVLLKDTWSENQFTAEISSFFIDIYPVTQALYEKVMGEEKNKSAFEGGRRPVENVKWSDAVEFCNRLSDKTGLKPVYTIDGEKVTADWDAEGFRLPTEAEWRYACRAGTTGERYGEINLIAWYKDNSNDTTWEVGKKEPNQWGLFDMLGNVYEWCWDWSAPYPTEAKKDWRGPESCPYRKPRRVTTGGSWFHSEEYCTCTHRNHGLLDFGAKHLGFRLARSV